MSIKYQDSAKEPRSLATPVLNNKKICQNYVQSKVLNCEPTHYHGNPTKMTEMQTKVTCNNKCK